MDKYNAMKTIKRICLPRIGVIVLLAGLTWGWAGQAVAQDVDPDSTLTSPAPAPGQEQYVPKVEIKRGLAKVTFSDGRVVVVPVGALGDLMAQYAEDLANNLSPDNAGDGAVNQVWQGIKDELSDEVSKLIGETEEKIMNGISDLVTQLAASIADVGTTPVSEVQRLKKMVKDGYTEAQKITYQNLKVDYAWKKSNTELSSEFTTYYNNLGIKKLFDAMSTTVDDTEKILNQSVFTGSERAYYQNLLTKISNVKDLSSQVNIVCNKGATGSESTATWMTQAERMDILDGTYSTLKDRIKDVMTVQKSLRSTYVYRLEAVARTKYVNTLYNSKSALNHAPPKN